MIAHFIIFLIFFVISSLIGQAIHWVLHQEWSGRAYKSHTQHHELYVPGDITSDVYRKVAWKDSGTFLFAVPFTVIVATMFLIAHFVGVPLSYVITATLGLGVFGLFSDVVHDKFHLTRCFLTRFSSFKELQRLHFIHHVDQNKNFGIVTLFWDRVFGTFHDDK